MWGLGTYDGQDLAGALLELRTQLRNLQWYGEVNRRGFVKITKKLAKKVPQHDRRTYVETKVDILPFATNEALVRLMDSTNEWLSRLGEMQKTDDSSSTHSMHSISHVSGKSVTCLSKGTLDEIERALRNDNGPVLADAIQGSREILMETQEARGPAHELLLSLLQRAISCKARTCIAALLPQLDSLDEPDEINQRNVLHRFIISLSRLKPNGYNASSDTTLDEYLADANFIVPATAPNLLSTSKSKLDRRDLKSFEKDDDGPLPLFDFILSQLITPSQRTALQAKDILGRMPLHYAAEHGYVRIIQTIVLHMQQWGQFEISGGIDAPFWQDTDGWSPLGLTVLRGHAFSTRILLEAEDWRIPGHQSALVCKHMGRSEAVLLLAVKENMTDIVKLFMESDFDLDFQDPLGETALHVAARYGHEDCARLLLSGTSNQKASTEIPENTFGWTALHTACVDGNLNVVELLVDAGADVDRKDLSGWTAKEHAALRGHMKIANKLAEHATQAPSPLHSLSSSPPSQVSLAESKSHLNNNISTKMAESVKSFGHKFLRDESLVLVSLGTMDTRKAVEAVSLERIPLADAHSTQLDTALSLIISASGASGEALIVDLPIEDNISTAPVSFYTKNPSKVNIHFDLVPTYAGSKDRVVGRGVAMLSSVKQGLGSKRISLQGDHTVPILGAKSLEVLGSVKFNFLIITPFQHPNMTINENFTYWKSMASTTLIGHRGLGKNVSARTSLQLGENTLQSFIAAANLGATYVEFDVQLTKDLVPVIYHDFTVSETGIDAPVHSMTVEQFLHVSGSKGKQNSAGGSPERISEANAREIRSEKRKTRSASVSNIENVSSIDLYERMKHTRAFKEKGFKGNSRGNFIQEPFTTLEEMFHKLPESTGFNIEMKYPMLFESEEQEMDTYAVELNSFVDTVLKMVYDFGKKRNIIFSSFNPDVCLLLSFKQPSIPILFLTDAGTSSAGDIRASSLQEAIRFASRWNLLGIVSAAGPLVLCPRLVRVVKESGLVCVSYGTLNNEPKNVSVSLALQN